MPEGVFQAALQAETSKIIVVTLALVIIASIPGLLSAVVLLVRSRTKITEDKSKADIEERRQLTDAFRSVVRLVDNKDQQVALFAEREAELRKANEEFQRSYIALSDVRSGQLDKMTEVIRQQNETNEVVRETVTKAESEIRTHAERSLPAIEIVKELPTTLQRIEESLKQLDEQLKAIPVALKNEIEPLMKTVRDLKDEVNTLSSEVKQVAPLVTSPDLPIADPTKTPPPGTLKAVVPPFTDSLTATNGEPIERLPQ